MSDRPPVIDAHGSGLVGGHVVLSTYAAVVVGQFVPGNWRRLLVDRGIAGDDLAEVEAGMAALEQAAAARRADLLGALASPSGSTRPVAEGQQGPSASESDAWISTSEAATLLDLTPRRVRHFVEDGTLRSSRLGQRSLAVPLEQVLALRRLRDAA